MCRKLFLLISLVLMLSLASSTAQAGPGTVPTWGAEATYSFNEAAGSQTITDGTGANPTQWDGYLGDDSTTTTYDPTRITSGSGYDGSAYLDFTPTDGAIIPLQGGSHVASEPTKLMIDVWLKPNADSFFNHSTVLRAPDATGAGGDQYNFWLWSNTDGSGKGGIKWAVAGLPMFAYNVLTAGVWQRVQLVWDYDYVGGIYEVGYMEVFIDGVSVAQLADGYDLNSMTAGGNSEVSVGWYQSGFTNNYWYDGAMDELTIATPEPATIALLGLGGLALIRRRRSS